MAKDKKSFLVYCDLIHTVKKMKKEDAGELFLHLLEYTNDLNPVTENAIVELVFEPIKQQLKRDLKAYETSIEEKSLSGRLGNLKRWNNDLFLKVELKEISLDEAENIAKHRKASHTDSSPSHPFAKVAVTDTVNDTVIVKDIKEENSTKPKVSVDWDSLLLAFNKQTGKKIKLVTDKAKKQILARLNEGNTKDDIWNAIVNCSEDGFHIENGLKFLTLEFISRQDKFEKYAFKSENKAKVKSNFKEDKL